MTSEISQFENLRYLISQPSSQMIKPPAIEDKIKPQSHVPIDARSLPVPKIYIHNYEERIEESQQPLLFNDSNMQQQIDLK